MSGKKRRRKPAMPSMILWDRGQQLRFVEAVERVCALVVDLSVLRREVVDLVQALERERAELRSGAARKAHATRTARKAAAAASGVGSETEDFHANGSDPVIQPIACQTSSSAELPAIAGKEVGL